MSSRPTPTPSASAVATGPRLTGTIAVTGAVRLTSTFTTPAAVEVGGNPTPAPSGSTCADYARGFDVPVGGGRGFHPPEFQSAAVNNETMYVSVSLPSGYSGPGTYDSRSYPALQGYFAQNIGNPLGPATTPFSSSLHGATVLTVNPDGSGSLQLVDWGSTEVHGAVGAGGVSVSGTIRWTCRQ